MPTPPISRIASRCQVSGHLRQHPLPTSTPHLRSTAASATTLHSPLVSRANHLLQYATVAKIAGRTIHNLVREWMEKRLAGVGAREGAAEGHGRGGRVGQT